PIDFSRTYLIICLLISSFISLMPTAATEISKSKVIFLLSSIFDLSLLRLVVDGIPPCRDSNLLIKDLKVDEVPLRIYQPKWPPAGKRRGILYFHGGAGTFGSISKKPVLYSKSNPNLYPSAIYRLAPEHPYPGQYSDCLNATLYFMRNLDEYHVDPALIILAGDSCGANFATVIFLCQICILMQLCILTPRVSSHKDYTFLEIKTSF
uniref:Alpha/beta hydrolase fold-3 domain-containing protein n=1 Tax=Meleagris gallopavo TaxID=9103 RepID=A0A803Y4J4_MELGA